MSSVRLVGWLLLLLAVVGCGPTASETAVVDTRDEPDSEPIDPTPETAVTPDEPAATVDAFYTWYLALFGDRTSGMEHNPLVEGTYRDSPLLAPELVARVDALGEAGFMADPILCAQDIPTAVTSDVTFANDQTPRVVATTSFENHAIVLDLMEADSGWQISEITCANTAVGSAKAFYAWYLGSMGSRADGTFRNLLVDGGYRDGPFLSDAFVAEVDARLGDSAPGGGDPFLLAQDIPVAFSVEEGDDSNTAVVHLAFNPGAADTHDLLVTLEQVGGHYEIVQIGLAGAD